MSSIGLFGGSFNPIHCGHIALSREILRQAGLDEIWLMVSPQNPLKQQAGLLADDARLRLARKALRGVRGIKASDFEFRLPRPSYTWNTLEALRAAYPDHVFSLIIGDDNWDCFDRWYRADDIRAQYAVIVYPREEQGSEAGKPLQVWRQTADGTRGLMPLSAHPSPLFHVSSTEVRERVRRGESIEGLVPHCIADDVKRLYSNL